MTAKHHQTYFYKRGVWQLTLPMLSYIEKNISIDILEMLIPPLYVGRSPTDEFEKRTGNGKIYFTPLEPFASTSYKNYKAFISFPIPTALETLSFPFSLYKYPRNIPPLLKGMAKFPFPSTAINPPFPSWVFNSVWIM